MRLDLFDKEAQLCLLLLLLRSMLSSSTCVISNLQNFSSELHCCRMFAGVDGNMHMYVFLLQYVLV